MVLQKGERVVIDFNMDALDKTDPPKFGYVTDIIQDEKLTPGTLNRRICYKVVGDDGKEYISIDNGYGKPLIHTFYSKLHTLQIILERNEDIKMEMKLLKELEKVYVDAINRRLVRGQDSKDLMDRYKKFCINILDEVTKAAVTTEYFNDLMISEFDKHQT